MSDRTKAMDELIAGDADLYDAPAAWLYDFGGFRAAYIKRHEDLVEDGYPETPLYASARIKGDKDRENPVERPHEPEYDHTQDGTANFERAMSYARSIESQADLKNSAYAAFMAERGDHMVMLVELAHQYMSDLRYPPAPDSKERRIERIKAVLAKVQP